MILKPGDGDGEGTVLGMCSVSGKALPVDSWKWWRASHGDAEQTGIILQSYTHVYTG